jgi:ATP-dependent Zn protease
MSKFLLFLFLISLLSFHGKNIFQIKRTVESKKTKIQQIQQFTTQITMETFTIIAIVSASIIILILILCFTIVLVIIIIYFIISSKKKNNQRSERGVTTFVDSELALGGNNPEKYYPQKNDDEYDTFNSHQL